MSMVSRRKSKIGTIVFNYIINNKRDYLIVFILFFIGLLISIFFLNNTKQEILQEIQLYLNKLISDVKQYENLDLFKLLKKSIIYNIIITAILWFGASTIIGIPIVYGTIILKGFSIGYTISCLILGFGTRNGILLSLAFLLLHNLVFIPTMFSISVSGVKLYKSIMKNKQRENIKIEVLRHTIFCFIMLLFMILSSLIEIYLSTNIAIILLKYIKI